jgi:triosephosphate isomerase
MKHYTVVGNWKMHLGPSEAEKLVANLNKKLIQYTHVTPVICPPFISIPNVVKAADEGLMKVGAQNLNAQDEGTYTGEVSGPMIKELAQYVIIGHSERRRNFHETDKDIALKLEAAIRNGLKAIVCIGENLQDRHEGHQKRVINDQLEGALRQISVDDLDDILITYEPVWAISTGDGKGNFAKPEDVAEMLAVIRNSLEEIFGEGASSRVKLLYGGSVNPDDCKAYLKLEHVDGLLVGGASLNYPQFADIINIAADLSGE